MNPIDTDTRTAAPPKGDTATGFYRLHRGPQRWWLIDPDGRPFYSVGLNHCEETNLKYPHNLHLWKQRYGSREKWIRDGVVRDLQAWGFNTIGWTADWVNSRMQHTRPWSRADFQIADMPYVLLVSPAEIECWNDDPRFPDVHEREFDAWCEYLARSVCIDAANDRNLVGYFLTDIPAWHGHRTTGRYFPGADPSDTAKVRDIAEAYYSTICGYIRRYDKNHLILGDRYHADAAVMDVVLDAMKPHVDVLSVQYFDPDEGRVGQWQARVDKPVLLADVGRHAPTHFKPDRHHEDITSQADRGRWYAEHFERWAEQSWAIGWHWCAYIENPARSAGVKDPFDEPHKGFLEPVMAAHQRVQDRLAAAAKEVTR